MLNKTGWPVKYDSLSVVYAEKETDDDIPNAEGDRLIRCFHFSKEPSKTHNIPFRFVVKEVNSLSFSATLL